MPPRGVKPGSKRARQYEHIVSSERRSGASLERAEEIAARTVNKARARAGEAATASELSLDDLSPRRRGGVRPGTRRAKGRTKAQLYAEARALNLPGRSRMRKAELEQAVDRRKRSRRRG